MYLHVLWLIQVIGVADSCYWQIFSHIVTMGKERPDSYNELTVETPTHR
jgi:hypothetical protein